MPRLLCTSPQLCYNYKELHFYNLNLNLIFEFPAIQRHPMKTAIGTSLKKFEEIGTVQEARQRVCLFFFSN